MYIHVYMIWKGKMNDKMYVADKVYVIQIILLTLLYFSRCRQFWR